jgi:surface protein
MKRIFLLITLVLTAQTIKAQADAFITTWVTTTGFETITLAAQPDTPNYTINWGDGSATNTYAANQNPSHLYINSGEYTVSFTGTFPQLNFSGQTKLKAVQQWGTQKWTSMANMFQNCTSLNSFPTQAPDLSLCTNMADMFNGATAFNQPLDSWNVNSVTNMSYMFNGASSFNQPIGSWNVSKVTTMSYMFYDATAFNQPIGSWDVGNVTDMNFMFYDATTFNQPIDSWNVSKVTNMYAMFYGATAFNQPLGSWDVSKVTNMRVMFLEASGFNQPIGSWNVTNVTNMGGMFENATSFNQPIGSWNVSNVTNMNGMFFSAISFNQPLGSWDVSKVTDMRFMFNEATAFNQSIGAWNVSNVTNMSEMFNYAVGLSTANYDALLIGWSTISTNETPLKSNMLFDANTSIYCNGLGARNYLINTYGWKITDSGLNCVGLSTEEFDRSSLKLYPNPVLSVLNVKANANISNQPYTITDTLGRIVLKGKLNSGDTTINVEHLSKGIYYLKVANNKTSKFIKE